MRERTGAAVACLLFAACGPVEPRVAPGRDGGRDVVVADGGGTACRGDGDGAIARSEVVFAPGATVRYRINPAGTRVPVDVRGQVRPDGTRLWDFSDPDGDLVELTLQSATDAWYASRFQGAEYAARLDPRQPLLGVYRATDTTLDLLGAAGETAESGTILPYDVPVRLLRFPLVVGQAWTETALVVDGRLSGVPFASRDRYDVAVDASGELRLALVTFPRVVRVRVELAQQFPVGPGSRRIQYLWLTECYGEVARVTSIDGETNLEFREAVEFRRLGL